MRDGVYHNIPTVTIGAGRIGIMPLPDQDAIVDIDNWQASLVISMTTTAEMSGPLSPALAKIGVDWEHLPITDFDAPDANIRDLWAQLSPAVHARLAAGQGVIVHCRGGCGRSGMMALRMLVEQGEAAPDALARLRAVRPCAVETPDQFAWAGSGAPH